MTLIIIPNLMKGKKEFKLKYNIKSGGTTLDNGVSKLNDKIINES